MMFNGMDILLQRQIKQVLNKHCTTVYDTYLGISDVSLSST